MQGNKDVRIFGCCNCYAGNAVALLLLLLLSITYCINNGCCCFWFSSRNEKFSIWRPIRLFAWRLFILYKFVCMCVCTCIYSIWMLILYIFCVVGQRKVAWTWIMIEQLFACVFFLYYSPLFILISLPLTFCSPLFVHCWLLSIIIVVAGIIIAAIKYVI